MQFDLWPAGGGEPYAIMATDDADLIGWMSAIDNVCNEAMMRSLYSGGDPVKSVMVGSNVPEWRRLLHEVADMSHNLHCADCGGKILFRCVYFVFLNFKNYCLIFEYCL